MQYAQPFFNNQFTDQVTSLVSEQVTALENYLNDVACEGYYAPRHSLITAIETQAGMTVQDMAISVYTNLFGETHCPQLEAQPSICDTYNYPGYQQACHLITQIDPEQAAYAGAAFGVGALGAYALQQGIEYYNRQKQLNALKEAAPKLITSSWKPSFDAEASAQLRRELLDAAKETASAMSDMVKALNEMPEVKSSQIKPS